MEKHHSRSAPPSEAIQRQKNLGVGLVAFSLALQLISLFVFEVSGRSGLVFLFGALVLAIIGLGHYAGAVGRAVSWATMGLIPVLGPILLFVMVTLEDVLAGVSVPKVVTRVILLAMIALIVYKSFVMLDRFNRWNQSLQERSDLQPQARMNLGRIYHAELEFYEKHNRFGSLDEIGFTPLLHTDPYTYRIDHSGTSGTVIPSRRDGSLTADNSVVPSGIGTDPPRFTATATANLDSDATLDQWHVNDAKEGLATPDTDDLADMPSRRSSGRP